MADVRNSALQALLNRKRSDPTSHSDMQSVTNNSDNNKKKHTNEERREEEEEFSAPSCPTRVMQERLPGGRVNPHVLINTQNFKRRLLEHSRSQDSMKKAKLCTDFNQRADGQVN